MTYNVFNNCRIAIIKFKKLTWPVVIQGCHPITDHLHTICRPLEGVVHNHIVSATDSTLTDML